MSASRQLSPTRCASPGATTFPVLAHAAIAHAQFEIIPVLGRQRPHRARLIHSMLRAKGLARKVTVPVSAGLLADLLVRQPVVDAALVVEELGVQAANAVRPINTLVDAGVLTEFTGSKRNRMWQYREVIAALDGFAARAGRRG